MKRILFLSIVLLTGMFHIPLMGQMGPEITFNPPEADFGEVEMGTVVVQVFLFENTGDEELIVSKVKPGCSCTKVQFKADTLAPGELGAMTLSFDTANRIGEERLSVNVWSNAGPGMHRLKVTGRVLRPEESGDDQ